MTADQQGVSVQLMVFSGRPDPTYDLTQAETDELATRAQQSIGQQAAEPPPDGDLGYHGFLVTNAASVTGMPTEFQVFRSVVTDTSAGTNWNDAGNCESFLLTTARNHGFGALLDAGGPPAVA